MSDSKITLRDDVVLGPRCPFTRDERTGSHPKVEIYEAAPGRLVVVCRHCNQELANQPSLPLLMEPYDADPRVRLVEGL